MSHSNLRTVALPGISGFGYEQPAIGVVEAWGATVPTDATADYAPGCLFHHTDGGADYALYVNEGTSTSCDFNAVNVETYNGAGVTAIGRSTFWKTCPTAYLMDPSLASIYYEPFINCAASAAPEASWTVTEDDAADTQLHQDTVHGGLLLTCKATTDNDSCQAQHQSEFVQLVSGKEIWAEMRIKTAAGATQIDWAAGFAAAEDLTGVADNMPANGIVFHKDDGDTNIDFSSSDNGTNLQSAAVGTASTGFVTLGFHFDGGATGSGVLTPYIDGVAGTAISSVTYATQAEMSPIFMVRNGDATTTQTLLIDYLKVVQEV